MFIMSNPGVEPQACLGVNTTATTPYPSMDSAMLFESNTCFLADHNKFLALQCFFYCSGLLIVWGRATMTSKSIVEVYRDMFS